MGGLVVVGVEAVGVPRPPPSDSGDVFDLANVVKNRRTRGQLLVTRGRLGRLMVNLGTNVADAEFRHFTADFLANVQISTPLCERNGVPVEE